VVVASLVVASPVVAVFACSEALVASLEEAFAAHFDWASVGAGEGVDQAVPPFPAEEVEPVAMVST
jgi:hypothetical protein